MDWAVRRLRRRGTAVLCVAVGPRACFPSGPSVSRPFWSLDSACDPVPRPSLCGDRSSPSLLASPPTPHPTPGPGLVTARARFRCLGPNLSPLTWVASPAE